jgi:ABC-type uncharacterized transport system permease subunit
VAGNRRCSVGSFTIQLRQRITIAASGFGIDIPSEIAMMLPYILTIVTLVFVRSRDALLRFRYHMSAVRISRIIKILELLKKELKSSEKIQ